MLFCRTLEIVLDFVLSPAGGGQRDGGAAAKQLSDLHRFAEERDVVSHTLHIEHTCEFAWEAVLRPGKGRGAAGSSAGSARWQCDINHHCPPCPCCFVC